MVVSPLRAEFGTEIRIRFILAPEVICEGRGRVLRTVRIAEQHGIAFEFSQLSPAFEHFLQNLAGASSAERERFLCDVGSLSVEIVT